MVDKEAAVHGVAEADITQVAELTDDVKFAILTICQCPAPWHEARQCCRAAVTTGWNSSGEQKVFLVTH